MSEPQPALTYEKLMALFLENREQIQQVIKQQAETAKHQAETAKHQAETAKQQAETDRIVKEAAKQQEETAKIVEKTSQTVGNLGNRVGKMFEALLGEGSLVAQFRELGYKVKSHSQNKVFGEEGTADSGEIDLFLEDGDVAILVESKTTLSMKDVEKHIMRIEKYRRFVDADGKSDKRFVGAVAGTVIAENVIKFAYEKGLYVIIQSARAVEVLAPPEGFKATEW